MEVLTTEVSILETKLNAIKTLHRFITTANPTELPSLDKELKLLSEKSSEVEHVGFTNTLQDMKNVLKSISDLNVNFIEKLKKNTEAVQTELSDVVSSDGVACKYAKTSDDRPTAKPAKSYDNLSALLQHLELTNAIELLENLQKVCKEYYDRALNEQKGGGSGKKPAKSNTDVYKRKSLFMPWAKYLSDNASARSTFKGLNDVFSTVRASALKPVTLVKKWNTKVVDDGETQMTFGDLLIKIEDKYQDVSVRMPNIPGVVDDVQSTLSIERLKDLADKANIPEHVNRIDALTRELLVPASSVESKDVAAGIKSAEEFLSGLQVNTQEAKAQVDAENYLKILTQKVASSDSKWRNYTSTIQKVLTAARTANLTTTAGVQQNALRTPLTLTMAGQQGKSIMPLSKSIPMFAYTPDAVRFKMYADTMQQHVKSIKDSPMIKELQTVADNTTSTIQQLLKTLDQADCDRSAVRRSVLRALETHVRMVKATIDRLARKQEEFIVWQNRRPLEYMLRWGAIATNGERDAAGQLVIRDKSPEQENLVRYFQRLEDAQKMSDQQFEKAEAHAMTVFAQTSYARLLSEDAVAMEDAQKLATGLEKFIVKSRMRLNRMYSVDGYDALDVLTNPVFVAMYLIKSIRALIVWLALVFAKSIFMPFYKDAVYVGNRSPPHPLWFLLTFVAIDAALNVALVVILLTTKYILRGTMTGETFISDQLMRAVFADYVACTALTALLGVIIAVIIKRKKYFRYRFEGDRGIRAMSDMLFWTALVVTVIPFFRLVVQ